MAQELPVISSPHATEGAHAPVAFEQQLAMHGLALRAATVEVLQVNIGKLCNQACQHCHVDAGPKRTEIMTRGTIDQVLAALRQHRISVLDITGGAPELNPSFRYLVTAARQLGAHVMVRHNLTVMFEPGQEDLPAFFRAHKVEVVSSLPYFLEQQTDAQRGRGVFEKSVAALRRLNAVGYGVEGTNHTLNLVTIRSARFCRPRKMRLRRISNANSPRATASHSINSSRSRTCRLDAFSTTCGAAATKSATCESSLRPSTPARFKD